MHFAVSLLLTIFKKHILKHFFFFFINKYMIVLQRGAKVVTH